MTGFVRTHRGLRRLLTGLALAVLMTIATAVTGAPTQAAPTTQAASRAQVPPADQFVTRQGSQLFLAGKPFRFSGPNIYWLGLDENGRTGVTYPTQFRVRDALATAAEMGATVVRGGTLGVSTGHPDSVEPTLGQFNAEALRHIDFAVATAHQYGLRLTIPLTNMAGCFYTGCTDNFVSWLGLPDDADQTAFFTDPKAIAAFEQYISHLLNHVNVYTGIPLKDDPTILAWETGNELHTPCWCKAWPPPAWTGQIATYIKSIDPHHLVMDGTYGLQSPDALTLPDVDLYSDHDYPMSVQSVENDGAMAAAAGKAVVIGEYSWNNMDSDQPPWSTGSSLPDFLTALEQTPGIVGDTYWDLFGHNDTYGYVQHGDGFTLHFPGDTAADRLAATQLRAHAYAMSGLPVPKNYPRPGTPVITAVEHVGAANLIEWRGAVGGAQYTIQRSTGRPGARWVTICQACATDNDTPWTDNSAPSHGSVWYRVQALNPDGTPGKFSSPVQVSHTVVDGLDDWSHVASHDPDLQLVGTDPELFGGDTSRAVRSGTTADAIVWHVPDTASVELTAYADPSAQSFLQVLTSADGRHWHSVQDLEATQPLGANWAGTRYTIQGLRGTNYIKVAWPSGGTADSPQLGEVRFTTHRP